MNKNLFNEDLVSGSVMTRSDLDKAFASHPNLAKEYLAIALYREDVRKWYEENWPRVRDFLDADFSERFRKEEEHNARAWEFHLAVVLFNAGLNLVKKSWEAGPDFCLITPEGKKVWVEAIACDLGDVDPVEPYPDMIPGRMYSFGGNIEEMYRPKALRITSAVGTKFQKVSRYLKNTNISGVSEHDIVLIAVNGRAIQHHADDRRLFKRAIFGQGPDVLVKRAGRDELEGGFYKPLPVIQKKGAKGTEDIPASFMEMEEFSKISAVLYCGHNAAHSWYNNYGLGDDFFFAYHVKPINPIPDSLFKFGVGIRKDVTTGKISEYSQKETSLHS